MEPSSTTITFENGESQKITSDDVRGYLGVDRWLAFPNESVKAHDCAVAHAIKELRETGSVDAWTKTATGADSFTITTSSAQLLTNAV